jgi:hypothetical protein
MKKLLGITLLSCLAIASVRADVIWTENFAYPNGNIPTVSGGVWVRNSGTGNDAYVYNGYDEISATSGTLSRQDDCYRYYGNTYSNKIISFVSFTVICTNLPTAANSAGTYFTSFYSTNNGFYGRIYGTLSNTVMPNTWRLAVSANKTAWSTEYPVDLATNVPYQVVAEWDPVNNLDITLWVNPISVSDGSINSIDTFTQPLLPVNAFATRQASGFANAFFKIGSLVAATTFAEASPTATANAPSFIVQPQNTTNFVGAPTTLAALPNGQSLKDLTFQWQENDTTGNYTNIPVSVNPSATASVFTNASPALSDSGQYRVIVTNPNSTLSATSSSAWLVFLNIPVPPQICGQPVNAAVYYGQTVTLSVCASGTPPIVYQWYYNTVSNYSGSAVIDGSTVGTNDTGQTSAALIVANVRPANTTTGYYYCHLTAPNTLTTNTAIVQVSAIPPAVTNIYYLRGLVDPVFYLPTNTTTFFQVTGTVISKQNMTASTSSEFFIQDATGGICVFVGGGNGWVPNLGDNVTVTGPLGNYNSLMEFALSATNPGHTIVTNSSGNALPPSTLLPCSFTNSPAYGGISNAFRQYQGSLLTFTNVTFPDADGVKTWADIYSGDYQMIDSQGNSITLYAYYNFTNMQATIIPTGTVWRVTGPMSFFLSTTAADRSAGYQFEPSMVEDWQINPATTAVTLTSGNPTLTWPTLPLTLYSVLRATNVTGPYGVLATGLYFPSTNGQYMDANPTPATRYYKITCP